MTDRRFATDRPQPRLEYGTEGPRPACDGNSYPYDVIIDGNRGHGTRIALQEARTICANCPIAVTCLTIDNRDEEWAKLIRGIPKPPPTMREGCGTKAGSDWHYNKGEQSCEPCRIAANEAKRRRQNRRIAVCGSDGGYFRHLRTSKDTPCDPCKEAHAMVQEIRVKRRKLGIAA